jgi:hypothetical protein
MGRVQADEGGAGGGVSGSIGDITFVGGVGVTQYWGMASA